jgi:hypothetical protein
MFCPLHGAAGEDTPSQGAPETTTANLSFHAGDRSPCAIGDFPGARPALAGRMLSGGQRDRALRNGRGSTRNHATREEAAKWRDSLREVSFH